MIRVLLVDDQVFFCKVLQDWMEQEDDLEVVGYAHNGEKAIELVDELQPDVVVMDVEMPEMSGITATEIICQRFPKVTTIIFSANDNYDYLAQALQAGAKGYILKGADQEELIQTIRSIYKGYRQLESRLLEKIIEIAGAGNQLREYVEESRMMLDDVNRTQKKLEQNINEQEIQLNQKLKSLVQDLSKIDADAETIAEKLLENQNKLSKNVQESEKLRKLSFVTLAIAILALIIAIVSSMT